MTEELPPGEEQGSESPVVVADPVSGAAVTACVLGILAVLLLALVALLGFLSPAVSSFGVHVGAGVSALLALAAVVFGHAGWGAIGRLYSRLRGGGLATTGLILGYLGLCGVVATIAALHLGKEPAPDLASSPATPSGVPTASAGPSPSTLAKAKPAPSSKLKSDDYRALGAVVSGLKQYHLQFKEYPFDQEDFGKIQFSADDEINERIERMTYVPPSAAKDGWILQLRLDDGSFLEANLDGRIESVDP